MKRLVLIILVLLISSVLAEEVILEATADTWAKSYVDNGVPSGRDTNFGTSSYMKLGTMHSYVFDYDSPDGRDHDFDNTGIAWINFDLSLWDLPVEDLASASLFVKVGLNSSLPMGPTDIQLAGAEWEENTLTWNNQPASTSWGALLANPSGSATWFETVLSASKVRILLADPDGFYGFRLYSPWQEYQSERGWCLPPPACIATRESGDAPYLVLRTDGDAPEADDQNPAEGATDVPRTSDIVFHLTDDHSGVDVATINFTVEAEDSSRVSTGNETLAASGTAAGKGTITGSLSIDDTDIKDVVCTFTPDGNLPAECTITCTVAAGLADNAGNATDTDIVWSFVTVDDSTVEETTWGQIKAM